MDRSRFIAALRRLGLSQRAFAHHTGVHQTTVYHWGSSAAPVPKWAVMLVTAWLENRRLAELLQQAQERTLARDNADWANARAL